MSGCCGPSDDLASFTILVTRVGEVYVCDLCAAAVGDRSDAERHVAFRRFHGMCPPGPAEELRSVFGGRDPDEYDPDDEPYYWSL